MRNAFGLILLLIVLAIVALNARNALHGTAVAADAASAAGLAAPPAGVTPQQQVDAVQHQVEQDLAKAAAAQASEAD